MSKLPEDLNNRFILYLNVLPVVEKVMMYLLFCTGIVFLLGSMSRILLLNWNLQKKAANMDFSHGNSQELKRIHIKNMKSKENKHTSDKAKEVEAFYSSLLVSSAPDDIPEESINSTEMDVLTGDKSKTSSIIIPVPDTGIDNYSCDNVENHTLQYNMIDLSVLKEAIV
jgi:hypothetical protein